MGLCAYERRVKLFTVQLVRKGKELRMTVTGRADLKNSLDNSRRIWYIYDSICGKLIYLLLFELLRYRIPVHYNMKSGGACCISKKK